MPYVHVSTTKKLDKAQKEALWLKITEIMPILPGKTYANTMIHIDDGCFIRKGDADECCFIDVRVYKSSPEEAKAAFCKAMFEVLEGFLGIPSENHYMNITEQDRWASHGDYH